VQTNFIINQYQKRERERESARETLDHVQLISIVTRLHTHAHTWQFNKFSFEFYWFHVEEIKTIYAKCRRINYTIYDAAPATFFLLHARAPSRFEIFRSLAVSFRPSRSLVWEANRSFQKPRNEWARKSRATNATAKPTPRQRSRRRRRNKCANKNKRKTKKGQVIRLPDTLATTHRPDKKLSECMLVYQSYPFMLYDEYTTKSKINLFKLIKKTS